MRIGYWKSGRVLIDLTSDEIERLGGYGARISIRRHTTGQKGRATSNRTPQFWVSKDADKAKGFTALIRRRTKTIAKQPECVGYALFTGINGSWASVPDFALLGCNNVAWQPELGRYAVDMKWDERRPAGDRGKARKRLSTITEVVEEQLFNGAAKLPVAHKLLHNALDRANRLADRAGAELFVEAGKVRATVTTTTKHVI